MGVAFEMARVALGLADRGDLANEILAKRIIELAKAGERNLCGTLCCPLVFIIYWTSGRRDDQGRRVSRKGARVRVAGRSGA